GEFAFEPPRLEKFHLPAGVRSRTICGRSSVRSVTCNVLLNTSGITSTPTLSPLAVTNGALPNAGSSAIARSSAETLPERIESFRFPMVTFGPNADEACVSIVGRKLFTFTRKGRAIATTSRIRMRIPIIFAARFIMMFSPARADEGRNTEGPRVEVSLSNQEAELLRFLLELRIRQGAAVKLFLAFAALLVHHARSGFHLRLGFLRSPQFLQELSAQIMDTRTGLIELACGLNLRQRLFELAFALINTGQLVMRTGECRIEPQCFAKILFCFLISLLKVVNHPKLIVVVRDVGIECYIFEKFRFSAIEILLFEISPSEIEMNEGEPGIALSR